MAEVSEIISRLVLKCFVFGRHGSADCNGVIVLMLPLTSEAGLLRFNTSLLWW